jgi:hypothetical protein
MEYVYVYYIWLADTNDCHKFFWLQWINSKSKQQNLVGTKALYWAIGLAEMKLYLINKNTLLYACIIQLSGFKYN